MAIVFAHSNLAQFRTLHGWLCSTGKAESYLLCSESNQRKWSGQVPNLVSFRPHGGTLKADGSFYYLTRVEGAQRRSLGIRQALKELQKTTRVDLFVGHVTAGSPSMLFDDEEFDFPIVTYLEFPSFRAHGWDPKYPPSEIKQLRDRSFEMLSWHSVLRSDHAIVPSEYARSLFPEELQPKISVLMEGFELGEWLDTPCRESGEYSADGVSLEQFGAAEDRITTRGVVPLSSDRTLVGFAARDLSSAKGFEQFVRIANRVADLRPDVHFVVLGSEKLLYSYEDHFLDAKYGEGHGRSFRDEVLDTHSADRSRFTFTGLLDHDEFAATVEAIDLFLYPLQFGSANWGLFELLARGRIVIGSNRCFVPEAITDGENGFLIDYDEVDSWVTKTVEILAEPPRFRRIGEAARRRAGRYSIDKVGEEFLRLAEQIISK
jgi:glycosyltransferase involved in cell wall biosynthesis